MSGAAQAGRTCQIEVVTSVLAGVSGPAGHQAPLISIPVMFVFFSVHIFVLVSGVLTYHQGGVASTLRTNAGPHG